MDKRFQHSAGAYGISGKFLWPVNDSIKVRPSVDLPPTGGFGQDIAENFNFHELLSFRRAYVEVSGSPNIELVDGREIPADNNLSLSVVEDFNLLHVVEVRKMVSRITTRYFQGADELEIVLSGSRFEGFRIFGQEIVVKLATDLFLSNATHTQLHASYQGNGEFRDRFHKLTGGSELAPNAASLRLSLVEKIIVPHPTTEFTVHGNMIDIPHVGKLYLAELNVTPNSKALNMIRWDLGCPSGGDGGVGGGQGGGSPPGA